MEDSLIPQPKRVANPRRQKRQDEALVRQTEYAALSTKEKIQRLDDKLGVGVGAVKQRARLDKPAAPAVVVVKVGPVVVIPKKEKRDRKKYAAPGTPQTS